MKQILLVAALACRILSAQDAEPKEAKGSELAKAEKKEETDPNMPLWKWANFLILAGGLGYIATKALSAHFKVRSQEIQKDIAEAQAMKRDAEKRAAEIDARVSALGSEMEKLRENSKVEMQREAQRITEQTATSIAKLEAQASAEIETAGKAAQRDLKKYAANLAVDLAEQRIRSRMDAAGEGALVDGFLADLGRQGAKN